MFKVLKAFPYSADGKTTDTLPEGAVHDIREDLVEGLLAAGFIQKTKGQSTTDKAAAQKAAAEKAEADKAAAEKAEADKAAAENAEADKATAEKAEADKAAAEKAEA